MGRAILELLIAAGVFYLIGWTLRTVSRALASRRKVRVEETLRVRVALQQALESNDYGKVDDWLILYGNTQTRADLKRINERRDDMYLRQNSDEMVEIGRKGEL